MTYQSPSDIEYDTIWAILDEPRQLPQMDLDWLDARKDGVALSQLESERLNAIRLQWEVME